jgi:prepilin-type N-terminal cleavage/methylation domain-containing protein
MYNKSAFTIIELIFVIVIISILSAVAIPKLAATRDDAIDAVDCKNIAVCVTDMLSEYTASRIATKNTSDACKRAESSDKNNITVTVTGSDVTISGAPRHDVAILTLLHVSVVVGFLSNINNALSSVSHVGVWAKSSS